MADEMNKDQENGGCCGGHGHGENGGCCGGHGHGENGGGCGGHGHDENGGCCGGHGHDENGGCCGGHGHDENGGCCGGHGHDENGGCCGGHGHDENEEFDYEKHDVKLPDPTLTTIVSTLAQQAMLSMGILPHPSTGKSVFMMNQAKYLIDSIDVLFNKTEGNRTEDETRVISNVMSELRMLYVKAAEEKARRAAAK